MVQKPRLLITQGFGDLPSIGYQNRPRLFELAIHKMPVLPSLVIEINERITADGRVLRAPDLESVRSQLAALRPLEIESLAICFCMDSHFRLTSRSSLKSLARPASRKSAFPAKWRRW